MTEYQENRDNWGRVYWKEKQDPGWNWVFPVVTGHKYKLSWGNAGLDFEQMKVWPSEKWEETDKNVYFVHNFTDIRAEINVTKGWSNRFSASDQIMNDTIPSKDVSNSALVYGQNVLYNQTEVREFHFVVNGKNNSAWTML